MAVYILTEINYDIKIFFEIKYHQGTMLFSLTDGYAFRKTSGTGILRDKSRHNHRGDWHTPSRNPRKLVKPGDIDSRIIHKWWFVQKLRTTI